MSPPPATSTDDPIVSDEQIRSWIRACPETWDVAASEEYAASAASDRSELDRAILQRVLGGEVGARAARERRRARLGAVVAIGMLTAGTAVGVAALVRSGQPSAPEAGIICRSAASLDADAVVLLPADDPIRACASAWESGRLAPSADVPPADSAAGDSPPAVPVVVPALVACIGEPGAVEVFPGDGATCGLLGLEPADGTLDAEAQAVVQLQERMVAEVNMACVSGMEIRPLLEQMLSEAALSHWTVQLTADASGAACVRVAIDGAARMLVVAAKT